MFSISCSRESREEKCFNMLLKMDGSDYSTCYQKVYDDYNPPRLVEGSSVSFRKFPLELSSENAAKNLQKNGYKLSDTRYYGYSIKDYPYNCSFLSENGMSLYKRHDVKFENEKVEFLLGYIFKSSGLRDSEAKEALRVVKILLDKSKEYKELKKEVWYIHKNLQNIYYSGCFRGEPSLNGDFLESCIFYNDEALKEDIVRKISFSEYDKYEPVEFEALYINDILETLQTSVRFTPNKERLLDMFKAETLKDSTLKDFDVFHMSNLDSVFIPDAWKHFSEGGIGTRILKDQPYIQIVSRSKSLMGLDIYKNECRRRNHSSFAEYIVKKESKILNLVKKEKKRILNIGL